MKDWAHWVTNHKSPVLAAIVLEWLEENDFDEGVWQEADKIVGLLAKCLEASK